MPFRYFVIGKSSIGSRHASNSGSLASRVTHYGWPGLDLDAIVSEIAAYKGQAGVIVTTATKVRLPLIIECAKAGAAFNIENPSPIDLLTFSRSLICQIPH